MAWARDHGHETKTDSRSKFQAPKWWLTAPGHTDPAPSEMALAKSVLASLGPEFGHAAYRFTSAFVHAQPHAFTLLQDATDQYGPQTPGSTPRGVSAADIATWTSVVAMAAHAATTRAAVYFGWDLGEWTATADPIMGRWAALTDGTL